MAAPTALQPQPQPRSALLPAAISLPLIGDMQLSEAVQAPMAESFAVVGEALPVGPEKRLGLLPRSLPLLGDLAPSPVPASGSPLAGPGVPSKDSVARVAGPSAPAGGAARPGPEATVTTPTTSPPAVSRALLAQTGSDVGALALVGAASCALGTGLLAASRRRTAHR